MTGELLSLVVTVRPAEPVTVPAHLGKAVYTLLLHWLEEADPVLARRWHDTDGPKPFTCSSLVGGKRTGQNTRTLVPDQSYWFRLTSLDMEVSTVLQNYLAAPPAEVDLEGVLLPVESLTTDPAVHPWAGASSYQEIAAPYLLARDSAPRRLTLEFVAPVVFRHNNMTVPLPLPDLLFGGLAERWNMFSPVAIGSEVRRYCAFGVALNNFRLRSAAVPVKDAGPQIGSVGEATYVAVQFDRYWMGVLSLLANFVFYAGAGRLTTIGLGQTRRVA